MKTQTQKSDKRLLNRTEQLGTARQGHIDYARRRANRSLDTEKLLDLLQAEAPKFFELAEVVGKWVWIQFENKQPVEVTRVLSELGFHWNNARQAWQHPCGLFREQPLPVDPREKYHSYFAGVGKQVVRS